MPSLTAAQAQRRFLGSPVARLASVTPAGDPHLVPVTFAACGSDTLVSAVDHKPKRTTALARLANIVANPAVALLVDHYDSDWSQLWWARAEGHARVLGPGAGDAARTAGLAALAARYDQYTDRPPAGPMILIVVTRWSGWEASR